MYTYIYICHSTVHPKGTEDGKKQDTGPRWLTYIFSSVQLLSHVRFFATP